MTADDPTPGNRENVSGEWDSTDAGEFKGRRFDGLGGSELTAGFGEASIELDGYAYREQEAELELTVDAGPLSVWVTLSGEDRLAFLDEVHRLVTETAEATPREETDGE
jgi:hypothetical protein